MTEGNIRFIVIERLQHHKKPVEAEGKPERAAVSPSEDGLPTGPL